MQVLPSQRELLSGQRALPDAAQQNMVLIRFPVPVPKLCACEFLRIHLTPGMLAGSEAEFHHPELFARDRMTRQNCVRCHQPQKAINTWLWQCLNPRCPNRFKTHNVKPPRGVVQVLVPSDAVTHVDGVEHMSKLVMVLDRRYHQSVLAAVYRTAGQLADELGIRIK